MKKILLFTVASLFVTVSLAQGKNKNKSEAIKVDFYGIDFSAVNVLGASETEEKFMIAFAAINQLLINEQSKYDVGMFLNYDIQSLDVDHATSRIDKLKDVKFKNNKKTRISLEEIVGSYPSSQEKGLIIVAKELNKTDGIGVFITVVFDGNKIISQKELRGRPGGFGLRNYWAGALRDGLKTANAK